MRVIAHSRFVAATLAATIGVSIGTPLLTGAGSHLRSVRPPSLSAPASPAPGPWRLVFDDEFTGTSLGPSWSVCYPWGSCVNTGNHGVWNEQEWYQPSNCVEQMGELDLEATAGNPSHPYLSCLVQTDGEFSFTYGYLEARIWLPAATDAWSALWLLSTHGARPEIDVLEGLGADQVIEVYHWDAETGLLSSGTTTDIPGATSGWHTYGVDWEPNAITWYVDGRMVKTVTATEAPIASTPMYIIMNLALGSFQPVPQVPATMRVDYVRVWQH